MMGCQSSDQDSYTIHTFKKIRLSSTFYAEGAGIGDVNGNGQADVVCGPYWYEGPEFQQRHTFYEPVEYDRERYSDNFVVKVADVNGNGLNDILVVGFPGQETRWYENPGNDSEQWPVHPIHPEVGNEAPTFIDLTGDGNLELVFVTDGYLGYATMNPSDPTRPWTFHAISEQSGWYRFTHGLGVGDIDGDGDKDLVMAEGWWENPGQENMSSTPWEYHRENFGRGEVDPERSPQLNFGRGGAQMLIYDVDDDGYNDVITSLNAHGWGLAWYRQFRENDEIRFEKQQILGETADENPYGVLFSEIHALELVDMDKNGIQDFVTGKRWWAHGPDGADHHNDAAVLYWFKLHRNGEEGVDFIPHLIDYDSGVGTQFSTGDLTGNGFSDIVICNKKGGFVFLNQPQKVSKEVWEFNQPNPLK